ncbi:MAG TPA: hypothetical protein P5168_00615 [Candidatus Methanomethylicus sp.]|nr:hypothetical protein [Candidatus Methanomethylicus sp.]HRR54530.1 hypothetical protein [Candidatus Methanomethylicus sp.]HRU81029.1 hypothetical protein [Candidatus Methanomethylicus sp.]
MGLKIEVFTSLPSCSGGRMVLRLMDQIKKEYGDKVEIEVFKGPTDKAKEYCLKVSPAIIIDKDVRIIGVCPSKQTMKNAIREAGVV